MYCKDCDYCNVGWGLHTCQSPQNVMIIKAYTDIVTGEVHHEHKIPRFISCRCARISGVEACGEEAKWFKPKEKGN